MELFNKDISAKGCGFGFCWWGFGGLVGFFGGWVGGGRNSMLSLMR